ncbi:2-oxoisovalerate dehydrogenase subunit alpha 1, mitochondrial-like isoform X1 [Silene latifolia]|uniref:2-oxoisovalerate dehydrogenase subunit alpha 1, mitochondrial-like isoform X1 n=1 Tax=Silene latifolia TaxID=37657 RepID=UPI003D7721AC
MAFLLRRSRNIIKNLLVTNSYYNYNTISSANYIGFGHAMKLHGCSYNGMRRYESTKAAQLSIDPQYYTSEDDIDPDYASSQGMDFPGGRVMYTSNLNFIPKAAESRVPCYRVLNDNGRPILNDPNQVVSQEMATRMYSNMITLQVMDTFLYEAQRQGRISFYMSSIGEEAINIASAAALSDEDVIFAQYREPGMLLWRGYTLQEFTNQCFGNKADQGKGRQMPVHYGSKMHNFFTISSPIATQLPQAAGAAYSLKMEKKDACVVAFMGDGCTSEGDFHAGLNFAAVMEVPIVFICRNNGWAISTPITDQFRSDGVVVKGRAYGIQSVRVDGNDALAVYNTIRAARETAISQQKPVLVEALTYRVSHHSTSDDSTKYRPVNEIEHWKIEKSPVTRFRKWVESNGWWNEEQESSIRNRVKKEMISAIQMAEKIEKPAVMELFTDVYDEPTKDLNEQEKWLRESIRRHPKDYPTDCAL